MSLRHASESMTTRDDDNAGCSGKTPQSESRGLESRGFHQNVHKLIGNRKSPNSNLLLTLFVELLKSRNTDDIFKAIVDKK